jgi:hypothetical protein
MRGQQVTVAVGTNSVLLLPPNPKRTSVVISALGGAFAYISFNQPAVFNTNGIQINNIAMLRLTKADIGELLCEAIYVAATTAAQFVTVLEGFD